MLDVAIKAAKVAGKIHMKYFGKVFVQFKEDNSPVTKADLEAEQAILKIIKENFPDHSIICEESENIIKDKDKVWIIDPLDGTTNFTVQVPFFNVSIAYAEKGEIKLGVVYYPFRDELFFAEKGKGAFLNDKKIKVSDIKELKKGVYSQSQSRKKEYLIKAIDINTKMKKGGIYIKKYGSAALEMCYVACGRFSGFIMHGLNVWDFAAGMLIVREAGGVITKLDGKSDLETKEIVGSNPYVHDELLKYK